MNAHVETTNEGRAPEFVGVDVAKDTLVWAIHGEPQTDDSGNDEQGFANLVQALQGRRIGLIAIEATGGYEQALTRYLMSAGLPVALVNARAARDFARGMSLLAKTDRVDARALAHYAHTLAHKADQAGVLLAPAPEHVEALQVLVMRRSQLVNMRVAEKNRLAGASHRVLKKSIETVVRTLNAEIKALDRDIDGHLKSHFADQRKRFEKLPGVANNTCAAVVAFMPELGSIGNAQAAKLVGLAPLNNDSGPRSGKRHVWGGRKIVRCALYMAVLSAIRFNPVIRPFYERLLGSGKAKKVAITACMHKLLRILNAMARSGLPWNPQLHGIKS